MLGSVSFETSGIALDRISEMVDDGDGESELAVVSTLTAEEDTTELARDAATVNAVATTVEATLLADKDTWPFSIASNASSPLKSGTNRVHHSAMRSPRSTSRCLRMKSTTRTKKMRPAKMSIRSSQSDFSSAVMRCLEVVMSESRTSCVVDVDFRFAVDDSARMPL